MVAGVIRVVLGERVDTRGRNGEWFGTSVTAGQVEAIA
jgi:hypothetical protein